MKQKQIEKGPKTGEQDPEADGEQEGSIHWCALGHTLKVRYLGMRSFLMAPAHRDLEVEYLSRSLRASENPTLPRGVIFFLLSSFFLWKYPFPRLFFFRAPLRLYWKLVHMI